MAGHRGQRASRPKVKSGCLTCKARHVKCDEGKPFCARCTRTGRACQGYVTPESNLVVIPKAQTRSLAPAPTVNSHLEIHALELFFTRTAPQLAGHFGHSFFQGSVLQLSVSEPAIREVISALGILHDQTAPKAIQCTPDLPIKLYNRAIRGIIQRVTKDISNISLVAMVNVLFVCFEYFQGNLTAAASHIKGGIDLLNTWRQSYDEPRRLWGQSYSSFEANFMEREVAPLLSLFSINALQWGVGMRTTLFLNPVDGKGSIILPERFETIHEARVALMDLVTSSTWHLQQYDTDLPESTFPGMEYFLLHDFLKDKLSQWNTKFDDLLYRQGRTWTEAERLAADTIFIMRHGLECEIDTYQMEFNTSDFDNSRSAYDTTVGSRLDNIVSNSNRFSDDLSKAFSLDFGMIFPLHGVAWRARWPHLHRKGHDLRMRIPQLHCIPGTKPYDSIASRLVEIEQSYLESTTEAERANISMSSSSVLIHDFSVAMAETEQGKPPSFAITFWSKPDGPDGPWYFMTENIQLGPGNAQEKLVAGSSCIHEKDSQIVLPRR